MLPQWDKHNTDWVVNPHTPYPPRGVVCTRPSLGSLRCPSTEPGANGPPRQIQHVRFFQPVCIVFISPPEIEVCVLCVYFPCFERVVRCLRFSDQHTTSQHVFPSLVVRNGRSAYSMFPEQHKTRKIHSQNTQTLLNY